MPEFLRAYIVVIALSIFMFSLLLRLNVDFIKKADIKLWRNYWIAITTISFFSPNIWVYMLLLTVLLSYASASKLDRLSFFMAVLCASPMFKVTLPGFGLINFLIVLSYVNILTLLILVPEYKSKKASFSYPTNKLDSFVILYVVLICLLNFRENTLTNSIRESINFIIAILIPYYALSRVVSDTDKLKKILFILFLCIAPLAIIGSFESIKHWKLYSSSIAHVLEYSKGTDYGVRGDSLRSSALFAGPLVLGYVMTTGIGLLIFVNKYTQKKNLIKILTLLFIVCLYYTKARGSWIGVLVLIILYIWSGPQKFSNLAKLTFGGAILFAILSVTSVGQKIISSLPFFSAENSHEASTVDYRFRLLEQSWTLFQKNPMFGLAKYRETPEMEVMRQGQGIIDVVNSYVDIGLNYGLAGLSLFLLIFLGLLFTVLKAVKSLPAIEQDLINIGRVLFAVLGSMLVMIVTVSSVDYIPVFYWVIGGLCSAYIKICANKRHLARAANKPIPAYNYGN